MTVLGISTIGIMLASTHLGPMNEGALRSVMTPGLYVVHSSGVTAGVYRNTMGRASVLLGYTHDLGNGWAVSAGAVSGYPQTSTGYASEHSRVGPYLAVSWAFGAASGARVTWSPQKTQPVMLAAEWRPGRP